MEKDRIRANPVNILNETRSVPIVLTCGCVMRYRYIDGDFCRVPVIVKNCRVADLLGSYETWAKHIEEQQPPPSDSVPMEPQ